MEFDLDSYLDSSYIGVAHEAERSTTSIDEELDKIGSVVYNTSIGFL